MAERQLPEMVLADHASALLQFEDKRICGSCGGCCVAIRKRGRPWFMALGFERPHLPFVAPSRYFDLYEGELPAQSAPPAGPALPADSKTAPLVGMVGKGEKTESSALLPDGERH